MTDVDCAAVAMGAATRTPRLAPLVLATGASQALLVVLAPTMAQIGLELGVSTGLVGQARTVTAAVAITASLVMLPRGDRLGVSRLVQGGCALAVVACGAVAAAPTYALFVTAHALVGVAFACLLSAGFAGVAAFPAHRRAWAMGRVAAANAAAWILVTPVAGVLAEHMSWRAAQAVPALVAVAALSTVRRDDRIPGEGLPPLPLGAFLVEVSARRWMGAELIAYGSWTAFLTFSGAFFAEALGASPSTSGWLLTVGPAAFVVASALSGYFDRVASRRRLVASAAMAMALLVPVLLDRVGSVMAAGVLCIVIGFAAGVRTPAAGALGLAQLPARPGAMMTARTAVTQAGYLVGAMVGGALVAGPGYDALGLVLGLGLATSAVLVLRVHEPAAPHETSATRRTRDAQAEASGR